MKTCSKCKILKPKTDFTKDSRAKDGLKSQCKMCCQKYSKKYLRTGKGRLAKRKCVLKRKYGLTPGGWNYLYLLQYGCCALCKEPVALDKIYTDHDHKTGKVRGLLCSKCNSGIGLLGDSVEGLETAIKYLEEDREDEDDT